jgi:hypothetical protein
LIVAPRSVQIDTPSLLPYILGPIAVLAFLYMLVDAVPQLNELRGIIKAPVSIAAVSSNNKPSLTESSKSYDEPQFSILANKSDKKTKKTN